MTRTTNSKPLISVIMPVFNRKQDLPIAIESILNQTVRDLELIIVDDGSADGSTQVTEDYAKKDRRITLSPHKQNLGLSTALNTGLGLVRGEYIARMDQDDISVPTRFQRQIEYMATHPDVDICGGWLEIIGGSTGELWRYPETHDAIYALMLFTSSLAHPTVFMKSETLRSHGLRYDAGAPHAEDYDLWSRALPFVRFANVPEVLLQYRLHATNTGRIYGETRRSTCKRIYQRLFSRFGIELSETDLLLHEKISLNQIEQDANFLIEARKWLELVAMSNRRFSQINPDVLDVELSKHWTNVCGITNMSPYRAALQILQSPLRYKNESGIQKSIKTIFFLFRKIKKLGTGDNNGK